MFVLLMSSPAAGRPARITVLKRARLNALALALIGGVASASADYRTYHMETVGSRISMGDLSVRPYALTETGEILTAGGNVYKSDLTFAAEVPGGLHSWSMATGLKIVGSIAGPGGTNDAYRWDPVGGLTKLYTRPSEVEAAFPTDINEQGTISMHRLIFSETVEGDSGFVEADGSYTKVSDSHQLLINLRGSRLLNDRDEALVPIGLNLDNLINSQLGLLSGGVMTPYSAPVPSGHMLEPRYLNNKGVAVGRSARNNYGPFGTSYFDDWSGWYWETPTNGQRAPVPSGFLSGILTAVDEDGIAFGSAGDGSKSFTSSPDTRAYAYRPGESPVLMNSLVTNLPAGFNIIGISQTNTLGDLAGYASDGTGFITVRLTAAPVPEPASLAVLGIGALALLRRRRGRA